MHLTKVRWSNHGTEERCGAIRIADKNIRGGQQVFKDAKIGSVFNYSVPGIISNRLNQEASFFNNVDVLPPRREDKHWVFRRR